MLKNVGCQHLSLLTKLVLDLFVCWRIIFEKGVKLFMLVFYSLFLNQFQREDRWFEALSGAFVRLHMINIFPPLMTATLGLEKIFFHDETL